MEPFVQLLGVPSVRSDGQRYEPPPSRNSALAYYLAFHAGEWIARDEACGLLWPDSRDGLARNSLRQALYVLRREPWSEGLEAGRNRIRWPVATDLAANAAAATTPQTLLEGFRLQAAPAFDDWLHLTRESVAANRRRAAHRAARSALDRGDGHGVAELLEPWLRHDPLDEASLRLVLEAKASLGLHADATTLYDRFAERLQEELGLAPSPETAAWVAPRTAPKATVTPTGPGRPGGDSPPGARTPFVGRRTELQRVAAELSRSPGVFVVIGPAGIGKTTFALEATRRVASAPGVETYFVALELVRSPPAAAAAVANVVAPAGSPDVTPVDRIAAALGARTDWVVLDNVEQIPDFEAFLREIRGRCPGVRWLVTSRRRLQIDAAAGWTLPGLDTDTSPNAEDAVAKDEAPAAVQLFEAVCRRNGVELDATRDRPAVAAFCRSVGGAPLAIELAAGWTRVLPLAVTLDRWADELIDRPVPGEDRPERHLTVRRAVQASCSLLSSAERAALARLDVFVGGCAIEAADLVADVGLARLATLRDASLIAISPSGRVTHHPAVAQSLHALRDELGGVGDDVKDRHARHYLAQLQRWEDLGQNGDPLEAVRSIQREHPNLAQAWHRAIERRKWEPLAAGGAFLGLSYALAGDGRTWLEQLGHAIAAMPERNAARTFLRAHLGSVQRFEGKRHRAYRRCRAAAADADAVTDPKLRGWIAFHHGKTARFVGRIAESRDAFEQAVRSWSRTGEIGLESMAIDEVTQLARDRAEHEHWYARGERVRMRGDVTQPAVHTKTATAAVERARVLASEDGAYREATELIEGAVDTQRSLRWNVFDLAIALTTAAEIRRDAGDLQGALEDAREAVACVNGIRVPSYVDAEEASLALARVLGLSGDHASAEEVLSRLSSTPSIGALAARVALALQRGDANAASPSIEALARHRDIGDELRRDRWRGVEAALLVADWSERSGDVEARVRLRDALDRAWNDRFVPATLHALALGLRWLPPDQSNSVALFLLHDARVREGTRRHPSLGTWRGRHERPEEPTLDIEEAVDLAQAALA